MTAKAPTKTDKKRLRAHFGLAKIPFSKHMWARQMYDSQSQRELRFGLEMWLDVKGLALVTGPTGVGKSITLRRFAADLDDNRYAVFNVGSPPATVHGFLRFLSRRFGLPMRQHSADLFDAAQRFLVGHEKEHGSHPLLILDDAEGLYPNVADALRRLTIYDLDAEDRFSILVSGIESLLQVLELGVLEPLRSRFSFAQALRPFGLEDTRNYIRFHLDRAEGDRDLFSDDAVRRVFQASQGRPRNINQLAIGAMILAAVHGRDRIDGDFVKGLIATNPLFQYLGAER
jgi:type II secretory pathway predicted ATPase ExeA